MYRLSNPAALVRRNAHLSENVAHGEVHGAVDDDSKRPVLVVLADEADRLLEIRVGHCRHRDEKLARE
jgi:hypothetical protein